MYILFFVNKKNIYDKLEDVSYVVEERYFDETFEEYFDELIHDDILDDLELIFARMQRFDVQIQIAINTKDFNISHVCKFLV